MEFVPEAQSIELRVDPCSIGMAPVRKNSNAGGGHRVGHAQDISRAMPFSSVVTYVSRIGRLLAANG